MIRTLRFDDFDEIHRAFLEAFSDYVVPMHPSAEALREMFTRRGWAPELSSGVFEAERLVAFTLNGFDDGVGYDTGSGVIPTHRRRGLARQTMEHSIELLRVAGAQRYVLEVLEANVGAAALYRGMGFRKTRGLDCWTWSGDGSEHTKAAAAAAALQTFWDVQPSWQNSTASLMRARDRFVTIGDDDGYAIVFPSTGDLPQLAVKHEARRNGIGRRLLESAFAIAEKPLRIINVDSRDEGITAFLEAVGAKRFVRQIEMAAPLQ
ncbi:MAG TPA: GNAT family N-acetyltransferase [Thermoanaerobaculia bacterium]|jgi:ribosomal protein S18 acetylase RimI-like enzyme|nr:GNAT family N-acetyltransferase [Thermoanaerobaculia bacterium]